MKNIYAVRDKVANAIVGTLWLLGADAPAIRIFTDIASDPQSMLAKHPGDFELLCLGELAAEATNILGEPTGENLGPLIAIKSRVVLDGAAWAATQQPRRAD